MYQRMLASVLIAASLAPAALASQIESFHATLSGFNETGALNNETGAILSDGSGTLELRLDRAAQTVSFTLTFANLSAPVTQSHIHFGKVHMAGGVMVFFCSNLGNGPAGTQACPANGGTVTGTITAADVVPITGQHVTAGDFDALVDALESHTTYVNVHTTNFPAGEIRGEIRHGAEDH
jgi:CHRD domain